MKFNTSKTKVMIFANKFKPHYERFKCYFNWQGRPLNIVDNYTYLGITYTFNNAFLRNLSIFKSKTKAAAWQLSKFVYSLHAAPVQLLVKLYNAKIRPFFEYCAHIWAIYELHNIEMVQAYFFKFLFNLDTSSSATVLRLHFGLMSLASHILENLWGFWSRILLMEDYRLAKLVAKNYFGG